MINKVHPLRGLKFFLLGLTVIYVLFTGVVASTATCAEGEERELYNGLKKIFLESIYLQSKNSIPKNKLCSKLKNQSPHKILKDYIHEIDEYGDYFVKDEFIAYENSIQSNYVGIGMLLYQQKHSEDILCIPTNKNLKKIGIDYHDKLISVNNKSVLGKNFFIVSGWIRGKINTVVKLKIKKQSGKEYIFSIKRQYQKFSTVQTTNVNGFFTLKILSFTKETPSELKNALFSMNTKIPVIIDLRGNGGGDYLSAIECADIFLDKNTHISSLKTTSKKINYYAKTNDLTNGKTVIILQDKFTASASEVFAAALTQNFRAESLGSKSFGKGVAQKFIPLSSGDKMLLSYAYIVTPNRENYNNIGLVPTSTLTLKELLFDLKY